MVALPLRRHLHLRARQHDARLQHAVDRIGVARLAIVGDHLGAVVFFLGHQIFSIIRWQATPFIALLTCARAGIGQFHQRQSDLRRAMSQQRDAIFDRRRTGFAEHGVMQGHQLVMQLAGPVIISPQAGVLELRAEFGRRIRGHRNAAMAAMRHIAQRGTILTRDQTPALAAGIRSRVGRIRFAVASLTPMMAGCSDSRAMVSTLISTMARPGIL